MKSGNASIGGFIFVAVLIVASIIGWVANIIKLFGLVGQDIGTEFVLRVLGIFVPFVGAIYGYF